MAPREAGYHVPPRWTDDEGRDRPKPALPAQPRIEQIQVVFPVEAGIEFQYVFRDGTKSPWRPATNDILKVPPGAQGIFWRRLAAPAKVATETK